MAAANRHKPMPQAFRIAMYRIPRRPAERLAQLRRRDRREIRLPLASRRAHGWWPPYAQTNLLHRLLPIQPRQFRRTRRGQTANRLHKHSVLFYFHLHHLSYSMPGLSRI